jgi:hypothetical protein
MRLPSAIAFGTVVAAAVASAQNIPTRTLSKPDVEYSEPFTQLAGIRELKDGRVIVADPRDKTVQLIDLSAGTATRIGREGAGPGEYSLPMRLFPLPGDSSAVLDPLNRRLLVVEPNGKPGGFIDMNPGASGGRGGMVMMGAGTLSTIDRLGRLYSQGSPIRIVNETPQTADSVAIERWTRATNKRDTLGYLRLPKNNAQVSGGRGGGVQVRIGGGNPFTPTDQWAASTDGRVAVVSATDYHIDWVDANGRATRTPPIRFDRLKVTDGHKQEWRDRMKNAMGMSVTNNNGRMSAQMTPMRNVQEPTDWPEYLPPFLSGSTVVFAPDGLLWIARTTPAGQPPTFDLIDGAGKVTQRVVLPKKSRLVGFGNGTIYVARSDDDDLQYLQRYRFAAPERP